jgi:hypothetical protein
VRNIYFLFDFIMGGLLSFAAELTFERNDSGEVVSVIHTQNGGTSKANRIESAIFIPLIQSN